jgi:AAA domain-containing protein
MTTQSAPSAPAPRPTGRSLPRLSRTNLLKASFGTVLGYGPAGAGKTRSIRTLKAAGMNPVVLVTELGETAGLLSLASDDIPFIRVTTHAELIEVVREMKRKPGKIEYEQQEFGAAVLDSVTQWGEMPLERYMELKGWTDLHGVTAKGEGKDPRTAYGYLAEKGRQLYKELFSLHGHLYIIAREGLFGGGDEQIFAAPELPGQKLPRELPGWPDATVRLRVIAGKHRMVTKGEGGSPARVRLPEDFQPLPLRCNPDIAALIQYMCGDRSAIVKLDPKDPASSQEQQGAAAPKKE